MKNLLRIAFLIAVVNFKSYAQEFGKNIGSVSVAFDGKAPKHYLYQDDDVNIIISDVSMEQINFAVTNKTKNSITFHWPTSYYVIAEETIPMLDGNNSAAWTTGLTINEHTPTMIAPESRVFLKCTTKNTVLFQYFKTNKFFQDTGKMPHDRAVLQFEIDGAKVEKTIPIEVYTSKIKKALKK